MVLFVRYKTRKQGIDCIVNWLRRGGIQAHIRDWTYQDLFHQPSELKVCQGKDRIEWESSKFKTPRFSDMGHHAR